MHYLIFVPGKPSGSDAESILEGVGLYGIADDATAFSCPVELLPDEHDEGVVVTWNITPASIPETLTISWVPAVQSGVYEAGRYLVGIAMGAKPTPMELLKAHTFAGESVRLGDGKLWNLPTINTSPQTLFVQDDRNWGIAVPPALAGLWQRLLEFRDSLTPEGRYDIAEAAWLVAEALKVNYRMIDELWGDLNLLTAGDNGSLNRALQALIHRDTSTHASVN